MLTLRKAGTRGNTRTDWLDSRHTFSFGDYYDPTHTGFRTLRVINEDRVVAGRGFATHSHREMEIVSYVLDGQLAHQDSTGGGSVIRPGEVQRMSAGTGVTHSELNPSASDPLHFLQIWILPEQADLEPGYEQRRMPSVTGDAQLDLIGSRDGRHGSVTLHQDVDLYRVSLRNHARLIFGVPSGRYAWIQVARGDAIINAISVVAGDGLASSDVPTLTMAGRASGAELLVFDLA